MRYHENFFHQGCHRFLALTMNVRMQFEHASIISDVKFRKKLIFNHFDLRIKVIKICDNLSIVKFLIKNFSVTLSQKWLNLIKN